MIPNVSKVLYIFYALLIDSFIWNWQIDATYSFEHWFIVFYFRVVLQDLGKPFYSFINRIPMPFKHFQWPLL